MPAEMLALGAAITFGANNFFMGIGLRHASPATGATVSVVAQGIFLWSFYFYVGGYTAWTWLAVGIFALGGICAPGLARWCSYTGFVRIGPANSVSLVASSPLFAALLAIIFLAEDVTIFIALGTALVVAGAMIISRGGRKLQNWRKRDMIWPFAAAFLFALRDVLVRYGLREYSLPMLAAAITVSTSFVLLMVTQGLSGELLNFNPSRRNLPFFLSAAICVTGSYIFMFTALSQGNVVVVTPLVAAHPLVTIGLTVIFLRKTEIVTWQTILGAIFIIAGAVVITSGDRLLAS